MYVCCQPDVFTAHIPENDSKDETSRSIILKCSETTFLCPCEFVTKDIYIFKEHVNACHIHRKKTIYVVPPVVKCIEAPSKDSCVSNKTSVDVIHPEMHIPDGDASSDDKDENVKDTEVLPSVMQDNTDDLPVMQGNTDNLSVMQDNTDDLSVMQDNTDDLPMMQDNTDDLPVKQSLPTIYDLLGVNQDLTCEKCNYGTNFDIFMESHKNVHNTAKNTNVAFACPQCPYSTADESSFVYHFNCHQGRKILRVYQCKYCELTSNQNDFIEDHLLSDHPEEDIRFECAPRKLDSVHCSECAMKFSTERELLDHIQGSHDEVSLKQYAERVYGVSVDSLSVAQPEHGMTGCPEEVLTEHHEAEPAAAATTPGTVDIIINPVMKNEVNASEGYLSCTYCPYVTDEVVEWKEHLKTHIGVGSLQLMIYCCRMCDWPSNDTKRVIDHCMKEHFMSAEQARDGGYETNCLEINNQVSERKVLTKTEDVTWEVPPNVSIEKYHCDVCEYSSNDKALLSKHKLENHGTIEDEEDENSSPPVHSKVSCMKLSNNVFGVRYPAQIGCRDRYICSMCPYTTDKAKHWHCHKVTHEKQMAIVNGLKCGYCKTLSTKLNTMRYHHNRYHGNLPYKFYKVSNGAVLNELVVNPDDMVSIGPPYQVSLGARNSLEGNSLEGGFLLKELLTLQRGHQQHGSSDKVGLKLQTNYKFPRF